MENKIIDKDLESVFVNTYSREKWKALGTRKRSGVLVPLFSAYSRRSCGIGDYTDLGLVVDWCCATGNSILQLLPMNDVGMNFCPYDSTSSFALEPMYLDLERTSGVDGAKFKKDLSDLRDSFPADGLYVDYRIKPAKLKLLRRLFEQVDLRDPEFREFCKTNSYWLDDFSFFSLIKSLENGKGWFDWQEKYRQRDPAALRVLLEERKKDLDFHKWVQWECFRQFTQVREHARKRGVLLKGDLPILVSLDSADVWAHPEYFKLDFTAGAPPDMYCAKGQRWGTPTYNWERIFSDKGVYLKEKLRFAGNFYEILRIDHVVGLFRIWSIAFNDPQENVGLNGAFDPGDERLWEAHGRKILTFMLDNTGMLLCAEDLGVIPPACTKVLKELGIPGNEVQRWTKDWNTRHDFLAPQEYRKSAVAMLSTHDTTNWPAWWEYEAGTVDEALFGRKCASRGIDFSQVLNKLFDPELSCHGRLRWRDDIDSADKLIGILGKRPEEVGDFVELYLNSFREKEKLWKMFGLSGRMREKSDPRIIRACFEYVLGCAAVFSVNLIIDWLYLGNSVKGDTYVYRYNTPGTVDPRNWSLRLPVCLEDLNDDKNNGLISDMIKEAKRK